MLIGAHVSTAGGLVKAVERGAERGCEAIQIFNQSPRMWRPTNYGAEDYAAFREAMAASEIESVVIHAIYLINCAAPDGELRAKSLQSLVHALRVGDAIGADGVVLHPGSQAGAPHGEAMKRVGKAIKHVLGETERCPLLLENTAGTPARSAATSPSWRSWSSSAAATSGSGSAWTAATCWRAGTRSATPSRWRRSSPTSASRSG